MSVDASLMQRPHLVQFDFVPVQRPRIAQWLKDVQLLFHPTKIPKTIASSTSTVKGNAANQAPPRTAAGQNSNETPLLFSVDHDLTQLGNVLEGASVHYAVQLIANLGHYAPYVRLAAVYYLFQLANIVSTGGSSSVDQGAPVNAPLDVSQHLDNFYMIFQLDDKSFQKPVQQLFEVIGTHLSMLSVALVAGLESFYSCPDVNVRAICVTALASLIQENVKVFLVDDQLSAIWNLYFALNSYPRDVFYHADRVVFIKALGVLVALFALNDAQLTTRVVESLLRIRNKTGQELLAIKDALTYLFKNIGNRMESPMYASFLAMVNPNDENAYDLLAWAIDMHGRCSNVAATKSNPRPKTGKLGDFVRSLSNHFRATPPLVRYGAYVCLHTAVSLNPLLLEEQRHLSAHIINGCLDRDYLTAFLCQSMLEKLKSSGVDSPYRQVLKEYRDMHQVHQEHYDLKYGMNHQNSYSENKNGTLTRAPTLEQVLAAAIRESAPVSASFLHKILTSLEFIPKPQKLRQLDIVLLWAERITEYDTFLMQALVPMFKSNDTDVQMSIIRIFRALSPSFQSAGQDDVTFLWSHLHILLANFNINTYAILEEILTSLKFLPLEKLHDESRREVLMTLFHLTMHPNGKIRGMVYDLIGESIPIWKNSGLHYDALVILLLSMGEQNSFACNHLFQQLSVFNGTPFKNLVTEIENLKNASKQRSGMFATLKIFDDIANVFVKSKNEYQPLLSLLHPNQETGTTSVYVATFWHHFVLESIDQQITNPDSYPFDRVFAHAPFWIAILFTKLSILPPPSAAANEGSNAPQRRDSFLNPTTSLTPAERRRLHWGFLPILLPVFGIPDPVIRRATCVTAIRCCFKNNAVVPGMMKALIDIAAQYLASHKQWTFQVSAFDMYRMLVKLKLSGISQAVLLNYLDHAIELTTNTPSSMVKLASLEFIETCMLTFPVGITPKLSEIRDSVRTLIVDDDQDVAILATRVYPLVFHLCPENFADRFMQYLKDEVDTIIFAGAALSGDPMTSKLSLEERERVVKTSLLSFGANQSARLSNVVTLELFKYYFTANFKYRLAALESTLQQILLMPELRAAATMWKVLPLYADLNPQVRMKFVRFLQRAPTALAIAREKIPPHPEDSNTMRSISWEELLAESTVIHLIGHQGLSETLHDHEISESVSITPDSNNEDEMIFLPHMTNKLMERYKTLCRTKCERLPEDVIPEVIYALQELQSTPLFRAPTLLVISEFCCLHDSPSPSELMDLLLHKACQDLSELSTREVEGCILGLLNIVEFKPATVQNIVQKIMSIGAFNDGELLLLILLSDTIKEHCGSATIQELCLRYLTLINSPRHALQKRLYAIYLTVELSLKSTVDEMTAVLDNAQLFIEQTDEEESKLSAYSALARIFSSIGLKHPLFGNLVASMKQDVQSKVLMVRRRSLSIFRIMSKFLPPEETIYFCLTFLADPNSEVREQSLRIMITQGLIDAKTYSQSIQKQKAPIFVLPSTESNELTGLEQPRQKEDSSLTLPLSDPDPFNLKYYSSEKHRRFLTFYGNSSARATKSIVSLPLLSVVQQVESRYAESKLNILQSDEYQDMIHSLLEAGSTSMLIEAMSRYQHVAIDVIENLLTVLESSIQVNEDISMSSGDLEKEMHILSVLSHLLFAFDGVDSERIVLFLERLQNIAQTCRQRFHTMANCCIHYCSGAKSRENLYRDIEESFFFYHEFVDLPTCTEEQFEVLESFKTASMAATAEIAKTGKSEKLVAIERLRDELNDTMDSKCDNLRRFSIIEAKITSELGLFYVHSASIQEQRLVQAYDFFGAMLGNEHRGIRAAAVSAMVGIAQAHLNAGVASGKIVQFHRKVQEMVESCVKKLSNEKTTLYRRKTDLIHLMSQLLVHVRNDILRQRVLRLLVEFWRDPDSEVRITCIRMIQVLGELRVPEVAASFDDKATLPGALNLMNEIASLLSHPSYGEKEQLNGLLKWYFANVNELKGTATGTTGTSAAANA